MSGAGTVGLPFVLGTFRAPGVAAAFGGLVVDDRVLPLGRVPELGLREGATTLDLLERGDAAWPVLRAAADLVRGRSDGGLGRHCLALDGLDVRAPVAPRQVFCSGANYRRHVVDLIVKQAQDATRDLGPEARRAWGEKMMDQRAATGTPFFFVKTVSSVTGPFDPILLPRDAQQPDWELELAVVIGRRARHVSRDRALEYVAGYTIANDVTDRDRVYRRPGDAREMGMDWLASKCAPSFLPLGPWLVPAEFVPDPQRLQITLRLNGDVMQDESTADMIFPVARLVEHASAYAELLPGDVICTGSPAGNGMHYGRFLHDGDVVEGTIANFGTQRNVCRPE
jgi:2-keto-4-pentenoate hydratase/2-oxohepta-3-ene-1,7-dioic acid hydratase in catechol pathway